MEGEHLEDLNVDGIMLRDFSWGGGLMQIRIRTSG